MNKKKLKRAVCCFLAALSLFPSLAFGSFDVKASEWAEDDIVNLDNTSIASDLSDINPDEMKKMFTSQDVALIRFQEYCYSTSFYADAYALYLYIYNPSGKQVMDNDCVINMATEFNADGEATAYSNVKLTLLDTAKSNTFLKFKVSDTYRTQIYDMEKSYAETHNGVRKYNISGITLYFKDGTSAKEYDISNTYEVSGYAVDMNGNDTSTLDMSALETISLDVYQTNYRTEAYVDDICDEINTVYFTVPNRYFEEYGGLQKIKAEWYEYKSTPIFVTDDDDVPEAFRPWLGVDVGSTGNTDLDWCVLFEEVKIHQENGNVEHWYNSFNCTSESYWDAYLLGNNPVTRMDWLFYRENPKKKEDWTVSSNELKSYMTTYTNSHQNTEMISVPTAFGSTNYSANLFADSIDSGRIKNLTDRTNPRGGYVCLEIDADKTEDILVKKDNYDWWDKFLGRNPNTSGSYRPIEVLNDKTAFENMSVKDFCNTYYVGGQTAVSKEGMLNWAKANCVSGTEGRTPVLFHFATTDYYYSPARFDKHGKDIFDDGYGLSSQDGYVAQETFFFNFDIISLTFRNENGDTVIPVVSNPFDIVNDITSDKNIGNDDEDWWDKLKKALQIILIALVVVVVIGILSPFLPIIFSIIWYVIKLPFKLLAMIFKGIGKLFKKKKN